MEGKNINYNQQIEAWMYRVSGEYAALFFSVLILLILGFVFSWINIYLLLIVLVGGIVFVRLNQSQYLGNSIRVHSNQFPEIFEIFKIQATRLSIHKAALYIKQDPTLQAYTIGLETCTVILTSSLVEQLTMEELSFVIAHELGHFKAGHTLISTLVNPIGVNNIFGNFVFGFWNRRAEYSCDRCGLILTKNIDSAISTLLKLSIGENLYKKLSIEGYISQIKKAESNPVKISEIIIDHPLITNRIKSLIVFWRENFVRLS